LLLRGAVKSCPRNQNAKAPPIRVVLLRYAGDDICAFVFEDYEADERSSLGIAARRCRGQMKAGRNLRSGAGLSV
jgi:hypothetical protein